MLTQLGAHEARRELSSRPNPAHGLPPPPPICISLPWLAGFVVSPKGDNSKKALPGSNNMSILSLGKNFPLSEGGAKEEGKRSDGLGYRTLIIFVRRTIKKSVS